MRDKIKWTDIAPRVELYTLPAQYPNASDAEAALRAEGWIPGHAGSWVHPAKPEILREIRYPNCAYYQIVQWSARIERSEEMIDSLFQLAKSVESELRRYAGDDPGAALTAGSPEDYAIELADVLAREQKLTLLRARVSELEKVCRVLQREFKTSRGLLAELLNSIDGTAGERGYSMIRAKAYLGQWPAA